MEQSVLLFVIPQTAAGKQDKGTVFIYGQTVTYNVHLLPLDKPLGLPTLSALSTATHSPLRLTTHPLRTMLIL